MVRRMRKVGVALFAAALALPSASGLAQQPQARESLESRLARVERMLESGSLADMLMQLEQLQREVQQLRGDVELQGYTMEEVKRRLQTLEKANAAQDSSPAAPATPEAGAPAEPSVPEPVIEIPPVPARQAPAAGAADPAAEQSAYQNGFTLLREGHYAEAINAFRTFLAGYPNSSYAGSAQYWLGEAYYANRNFTPAVEEFKKVIARYPGSAKDADARLKIGYAYYEMGEWGQARKVLSDLAAQYPNTATARLAENRLQRMRSEGR